MADPRPRRQDDDWLPPRAEDEDVPPTPRGHRYPPESRPDPFGRTFERRRPVGVVVIAALLLINAITSASGLVMLSVGTAPPGALEAEIGVSPGVAAAYLAFATIVDLVLLYGFWTWKRWGWWAVTTVAVIATAVSAISALARLATPGFYVDVLGVLVGILVVGYLTRSQVRALFDRRR